MLENILLALAGLRSNKMRSLLTMLGIIIGIGSVIAIVCVGDSLTSYMTDTMNEMGAGNIIIMIQERSEDSGMMMNMSTTTSASPTDDDLISDEMLDAFSERFQDKLKAISVSSSLGGGKAQDGRKYANVSVTGVNPGYADANSVDMVEGRFITDYDNKGQKNAAVVSDYLVEAMFPPGTNALGQEVKVYRQNEFATYTIVGIYHYVPSAFSGFASRSGKDTRTDFFIPLGTALKDSSSQNHQMFTALIKPGMDAEIATVEIRKYWQTVYARNSKWMAEVVNMETMISRMGDMMGTLSTAIAVIAAISLLVGGIGVMNIMLVSVTERTREIGTRKALGARNAQIRWQFIVEAVIICLIGGIIGIIVGLSLGMFGASLLGFPASVSPTIISLCVMFSMLVGVFFGSYPASKAAKLDPIEALRYE